MLSGKAAAATKPTALGSLLQAATYGQTIPTIYGLTQSPLLAIWAANLRQGGGNTKKLKQFLKGITNYQENIDFLLGHNPITGVLQMWNNGTPFPLNFVKYTTGLGGGRSFTPMVGGVVDRYALATVAVTIDVNYSVTFDDYGGSGSQMLSGTYEVPLWNELQTGPDPTHNSGLRNWPYCYRWSQGTPYEGLGITIYVDYSSFYTGNINIYYAQTTSATSHEPPIQKLFLAFEPELGDGDEYADADLSDQQIIYPMFAGLGSPNINLGVGGVIPQLQAEVQGKWSLYSTGDGDFADMIEDVFKSGVAQAALGATGSVGTTQVEHGLSGYSFPGCIQIKGESSIEADEIAPIAYNLQVTKGNFLVVVALTSGLGGSTVSISDTAGNTWTPVFGTEPYQVWYAQANATGPDSVSVEGQAYGWCTGLYEIGGVDTFDSAVVGSSGSVTLTTTNQQTFPEYLLGFTLYEIADCPQATIPQWNCVTPYNYNGSSIAGTGYSLQERVVNSPGTYSLTVPTIGAYAPAQICMLAFKCVNPPSYPAPVGDFIDAASLDQVRLQCRANGLWGSLSMNSQQAASDWLKTLYQAADAAPVFMGFKLYSMPYSEVSAVGSGAVYNAPTAGGPIYNLSTENGDFVTSSSTNPPIQIKTAARVNQPNVLQLQCINRASNYNPSVVEQPDAAGISLFGVRKADPVVNNAFQDVSIARQLLGIMVRKLQYGGDVYSFSLPAKWCLLAPMGAGGPAGDLSDAVITITDPLADIYQIPVRLTSVAEQKDGSLQCTAEAFVYGMYSPVPFSATAPSPYTPNTTGLVASINAPVIFEPVPSLIAVQNQGQVWVAVSSNDPNYGGAQVYISTDGGASYNPAGDPLIGSATTGVSTADWPAASSPDTTNDLPLDLTESNGVLLSYAVSEEDAFLFPCYIAGGAAYAIPYELMTYAVATLTATYKYTLKATGSGNHLNRGVFGAPALGVGVDHPSGSRWCFLPPTLQGILQLPLQPVWIGTTIYFKIIPLNTFGVPSGTLSDATAYPYTVLGTSGAGVQLFLVNGS